MSGAYTGYILSAYAVSALVLLSLAAWTWWDARDADRRLKAIEARRPGRSRPQRDAA
ncbi:heme exporter protein CcmD [Aureimonas frigidaquae]|uniref:heme exporter protein CcmD n=1 Tax=Aureimonas frigidaquae TaxID=424757 RepID=UPI0009F976BC|nr:heme exporter protein CcmD [Aureimonas frigidaquae]